MRFLSWCASHGVVARDAEEVDDLLVEYRAATNLSKGLFAHTLAAVELAIPVYKGALPWSKAVLTDMETVVASSHHPPLPWQLALLIATVIAHQGAPRLMHLQPLAAAAGELPGALGPHPWPAMARGLGPLLGTVGGRATGP